MSAPSPDGGFPILVEDLDDAVIRITLNRPAKRNAMNQAARSALVGALNASRQAKVIILTGAGPAFCAGIDLTEPQLGGGTGRNDPQTSATTWLAVQETIRRHPAVVIAVVNGYALGGGVTLINSSDLALAAVDAQIGMPEIGFGIYPGLAGPSTQLRISRKRAAWMVLTAERISGRAAAEWGLVNRAVPHADLAEAGEALARRISQYDAVTLEWCKRALWEIPMHISDWSTALEFGENVGTLIRARSEAVAGGMAAFASGDRKPGDGSGNDARA